MTTIPAPPVHEQPSFMLRDWIIVPHQRCFYLIGHHVDSERIRQTTPLVMFDAEQLTCRTESGRFYQLVSPPETGDNARPLLQCFKCAARGGGEQLDATAAVLEQPLLVLASVAVADRDSISPHTLLAQAAARAADPMRWLSRLSRVLALCDVDPQQHGKVFGLRDTEWPLGGTGPAISTAVLLRALLVQDLLSIAIRFFGSYEWAMTWLHHSRCDILGENHPIDVFLDKTVDRLALLHLQWMPRCRDFMVTPDVASGPLS